MRGRNIRSFWEMKSILFCGGSHLATAKTSIEKRFELFNLDYFVTAGTKNLKWFKNGGRYNIEGTIIGGSPEQANIFKDLSKYDLIIFVGQFIQISRFLGGNKQLLSKSILKEIFKKDCFINLPGNLYNQPLEIFPEIAPNKVILIPDPLVKTLNIEGIDLDYVDYFYEQLHLFCEYRFIKLLMPDKCLLEDDLRFVKSTYMLSKDNIHCKKEYWDIFFQKFNHI